MKEEFKNLFYEKLDLANLDYKEQSDFFISMTRYLSHGRTEEINGRTLNYVSERIDKLLEFLFALEFSLRECVLIITRHPEILNGVENLYEKYLFLGLIENMDNTVRKSKLFSRPRDFMSSLNKMYARYKLIIESGYNNVTWNSLVHASDREFCKIFVEGSHHKKHQLFDNELQVLDYLVSVDINELDMDKFKKMTVNEELVRRYEGKGRRY